MAVTNDAAPFLPEEIITNILNRLPVKSLTRFRCVCKHWKNLFKSPSFIQDHLCHSTHHDSSIVIGPINKTDGFYLFSFNCNMQFREFENSPLNGSSVGLCLVGSSNGLLCFADWSKRPPAPILWNPATREVRQMPITSYEFSDLCWHFGFGFSPLTNDYKIVRFSLSDVVCKVEVYSLRMGSWRNKQFDNVKDVCITSHGVTANGVMFWPGSKYIMGTHDSYVIVSFDLATEVFTVIPWPAFVSCSGKLVVHDDKLAIISHPIYGNPEYFSTYLAVMADYTSLYFVVMEEGATGSSGKRWSSSEKYVGNFDHRICNGTIWRNQIVYIGFGMPTFIGGRILHSERLYLADVIANECKCFDIPRPKCGLDVSIFNYMESLVPIGD